MTSSKRRAGARQLAAVCITGFAAITASGQTPQIASLPQLYGFEVAELSLPDEAGHAFVTMVEMEGEAFILKLEPYSIRGEAFKLLVQGDDGRLREVEAELPRTYRGSALGYADSKVSASLIDGQLWCHVILSQGDAWQIQPLSDMTDQPVSKSAHVLYREDQSRPASKSCGVDDVNVLPEIDHDVLEELGGGGVAGTGLHVVDLGCDADFEYFIKNGSSVSQTMFDIESIMNSVGLLYESQVNLTFEITTIIVRTGADPYSSSSCGTLLNQFAGAWNSAPESQIRRDLAQLFTGRNLSDCLGIAATPSTCFLASAYALVESRATGLTFNARIALSAHEIGHTLNALHCSTPAPGCSPFGDCRIMCACLGGCGGQITSFAPTAINQITGYVNSVGCLATLAPAIEPPFFDDFPNSLLDSSKWSYVDGVQVSFGGENEPSDPRAMNLDAIGSGTYQDDEVRTNFILMQGQQSAGMLASFYTQHKGVEAGETLTVEYWSVGQVWEELTVITSDGVDESEFTFHEFELNSFINVFHDKFRLRFRSNVNQSNDDWYVDDVFVGAPDPIDPPPNDDCADAEVITDGLTPFSTIDATTDGFPLSAACDNLQVDSDVWFQYIAPCTGTVTMGTCNLVDFDSIIAVSFFGACPPGTTIVCSDDSKACAAGSSLIQFDIFEGVPYMIRVGGKDGAQGSGQLIISCVGAVDCPEDLDGSGAVDAADLAVLLGDWGGSGAGDLDGSGTVDAADLAQLLGAWGPC